MSRGKVLNFDAQLREKYASRSRLVSQQEELDMTLAYELKVSPLEARAIREQIAVKAMRERAMCADAAAVILAEMARQISEEKSSHESKAG